MIGNIFRIFSKFSISPNGLLYKLYRDNGEQQTPFVFLFLQIQEKAAVLLEILSGYVLSRGKNIDIVLVQQDIHIIRSWPGRVAYLALTTCFIILETGFIDSYHGLSVTNSINEVYHFFSKFEEVYIPFFFLWFFRWILGFLFEIIRNLGIRTVNWK